MRIALVVGTRPQIIKSAPIIHKAKDFSELELLIIHTGQHYDYAMSREFFNELLLPDPIVNLGIGSGPHGWQTGQMLIGLEKIFNKLKPDVVLVPGDTNSALAGALAAAKMQIPVAHVESGARSYKWTMPEEKNRIVVDHVSDLLFAVSENCVKNLRKEGIVEDRLRLVGDTMYESIQAHMKDIDSDKVLEDLNLRSKEYLVLTIHRAENTDDDKKLCEIIKSISELHNLIIFPCHPRTQIKLKEITFFRTNILKGNFILINPIPYFRMLKLVKEARVILTDSGGLQKEALWLGTPCITLREETEWTETVEAGFNRLVGSDRNKIIQAATLPWKYHEIHDKKLSIPNASKNIIKHLISYNK